MMPTPLPDAPLILFDGDCNLCNGFVQFVIRHDPAARFRFAAQQSAVGQAQLRRAGYGSTAGRTIVLLHAGRAYDRSEAVLRIVAAFGGVWRLTAPLRWLPRPLRDAVYDYVAQHRHRWFGRPTTCWLPTPDLRRRFLTDA